MCRYMEVPMKTRRGHRLRVEPAVCSISSAHKGLSSLGALPTRLDLLGFCCLPLSATSVCSHLLLRTQLWEGGDPSLSNTMDPHGMDE